MKKISLIFALVIAFALLVCVSSVTTAYPEIYPMYVGNTMVDLSWWQWSDTDFSCCV